MPRMCGTPHCAASSRQRGFTLFELIVVLAVMAIAATLIATRPKATTFEGRTAILDVAGALREARAEALKTGRMTGVELDVGQALLTRSDGRDVALTLKSDLSADGAATDRDGVVAYLFLPSGMASGGQVVIGEDAVLVDWLTGRVTIVSEPAR